MFYVINNKNFKKKIKNKNKNKNLIKVKKNNFQQTNRPNLIAITKKDF
jgi:hypothetical protein